MNEIQEILPTDNHMDTSFKVMQANKYIQQLEQQNADLRKRIESLDRDIFEEICNRDNLEEHADRLSYEIGRALGVDVGEHSSANCPWNEAFFAIQDFDIKDCKTQAIEHYKNELLAYVRKTMGSDMHTMLLGVFTCCEASQTVKGDNNVSN